MVVSLRPNNDVHPEPWEEEGGPGPTPLRDRLLVATVEGQTTSRVHLRKLLEDVSRDVVSKGVTVIKGTLEDPKET